MAQTRILKNGTKAVASTVYLSVRADAVAQKRAAAERRSKSFILVEILEQALGGMKER